MINKKILKISFACILSLVTLASCNTNNNDEEWYGVGLDVDLDSRTSFLVGEKVDASMFNFSAYDNGEEVDVKPEDITIEPNRSLEIGDKQLIFKWKKYSTTLDINVSNTLISECELMDKATFKYTEPEHTLNRNGTLPDPSSEDENINCIDARKAYKDGRVNADGTLTACLSEVSYGSSFSYTFNTDNEGDMIYLYGSIASNNYAWGNVSSKYQSGTIGSKQLLLSDIYQLTNNGKVYDSKKTADIQETMVTEADLDKIPSASTSDSWFTVLNLAMKNFKRHWLGKVVLEKGANNIKIEFNKEKVAGSPYAYQSLSCGNWDNIEVRYIKKDEKINNLSLKISSLPNKQEYIIGDKFDIDGLELYVENDEGFIDDVDISKVTISNQNALTLKDKSITISYNGLSVEVPINVKSKVINELGKDSSSIKYIEPIHDRNSKNEIVGKDNENVDTKSANQNVTITGTKFLENVSAYSKFEYKYESSQAKGKFDIYASVASNGAIWGDVSNIWPGARNNGFIASRAIDFNKFLTLKNNDKTFEVSENAYIPETKLTKEMNPQTINADVTKDSWVPCVYFLLNNFQRIHIGTVDIVEGMNNITIDVGYNPGGFGYCESLCGNWRDIELIYVDENVDKTVDTVKMISSPRTEYFVGEKFSLENAKFVGYNKDGVEIGYLDNDKIEIIDNGALLEDTRIRLKYEGAEFYVDVKVSNVIKQELNTLENMTIKYYDQTDENDTRRANIYDTYLEKVSSGSYFEYVIESDKDRTMSISAEVATNAYIFNDEEGEYKDYNTGIEGFTQNYVGSYDLDLSKVVKLTNTVDNQTTTFETNKDAIAYGHVLNAKDDAEKAKIYKTTDADGNEKFDQWGMADALCMRNFKEMKLGEIKLSKGKNIIRISMNGYLNKNPFAYGGYACGNWKSITLTIK